MENDGRFVTTAQAARILGMSHNHVLRSAEHALHERGGPGRPNYYVRHEIIAMRKARENNLCRICKKQPTRSSQHATCGHPRCRAEHRSTYKPRARIKRHAEGMAAVESARIMKTWNDLEGLPADQRLIRTARENRVSLAVVLGVTRRLA